MILASLALLAALATQANTPERPHPMDLGPAIGARLIAFEAPDQDGIVRSLDSLKGSNGLMLVFFRSADW